MICTKTEQWRSEVQRVMEQVVILFQKGQWGHPSQRLKTAQSVIERPPDSVQLSEKCPPGVPNHGTVSFPIRKHLTKIMFYDLQFKVWNRDNPLHWSWTNFSFTTSADRNGGKLSIKLEGLLFCARFTSFSFSVCDSLSRFSLQTLRDFLMSFSPIKIGGIFSLLTSNFLTLVYHSFPWGKT